MGGIDLCFGRYEYENYPLKEPDHREKIIR